VVVATVLSTFHPLLLDAEPVNFGDVGLDRLTVTYDCPWIRYIREPKAGWSKSTRTENARYRETNLGVDHLLVTIGENPEGCWVRIDLTPAYVCGAETNVTVPPDEMANKLVLGAALHAEDCLGVPLPPSSASFRVKRLDLVRDLHFDDPSDIDAFIRGHGDPRPTYGKVNSVFIDSGRATGLTKGNKSRSIRLYD
jgi:hypothetical protein